MSAWSTNARRGLRPFDRRLLRQAAALVAIVLARAGLVQVVEVSGRRPR
jgi:hypothetical protein